MANVSACVPGGESLGEAPFTPNILRHALCALRLVPPKQTIKHDQSPGSLLSHTSNSSNLNRWHSYRYAQITTFRPGESISKQFTSRVPPRISLFHQRQTTGTLNILSWILTSRNEYRCHQVGSMRVKAT